MRGRPPQPIQAQIAKGDPSKHGVGKLQERLEAQPIAERGLPKCPCHLSGLARRQYKAWKQDLEAMNLDAKPDGPMLALACVSYARAVEADKRIEADGMLIEEPIMDKEGEEVGTRLKNHPAITISNQAHKNVKMFCSEFGLSPVSRTRLTIEKKDDGEAELRNLLTKPRVAVQ